MKVAQRRDCLDTSETTVGIDDIPPSEDQNIEGAPSLGLEDSITELVENDEILALPLKHPT